MACPSVSVCIAVGANGYMQEGLGAVVTITNGAPGAVQLIPLTTDLTGVACPSADNCVAVGSDASNRAVVVTIANGIAQAPPVTPAGDPEQLAAVACSSATTCEAVGSLGFGVGAVVTIIQGIPGPAQKVARPLTAVACPAVNWCEAMGSISHGDFNWAAPSPGVVVVVPIVNGTASASQSTPGYLDILGLACSTATSCQAVGDYYYTEEGPLFPFDKSSAVVVPITNGQMGAAQLIPGMDEMAGVTCPTTTTCMAVGFDATFGNTLGTSVVVPVTNGTPNAAQTISATLPSGDPQLSAIACPTATTCEAVGMADSTNLSGPVPGLTAAIAVAPPTSTPPVVAASFVNPPDGTIGVDTSLPFAWSSIPAAQAYYLIIGTTRYGGDLLNTGAIPAPKTSVLVPVLPVGRTLYASVLTEVNGTWNLQSITFTAAPSLARLTFPVPTSPQQPTVDPTEPFAWTTIPQAQGYYLIVGTTLYGGDLVNSGVIPVSQLSYPTPILPSGRQLFATLYTKANGAWNLYQSITFVTGPAVAVLTFPYNGETGIVTPGMITWRGVCAAQHYYLILGTSRFGADILNSGVLSPDFGRVAPPLPHNKTVYATLYTQVNGNWDFSEAVFTTG